MGAFSAPHVDPDRDVRQPAEPDDEDYDYDPSAIDDCWPRDVDWD